MRVAHSSGARRWCGPRLARLRRATDATALGSKGGKGTAGLGGPAANARYARSHSGVYAMLMKSSGAVVGSTEIIKNINVRIKMQAVEARFGCKKVTFGFQIMQCLAKHSERVLASRSKIIQLRTGWANHRRTSRSPCTRIFSIYS